MKTKNVVKPKKIERKWYVVDAKGKVVGRLASKIATVLQGKNNPYYSPQWDMGDHVVVINSDEVVFTGKKETDKVYYRHTGYPGGIKGETPRDVRLRDSRLIIERAVRRMLPKNKLAKEMIKKLHVFKDDKHTYEAQKPQTLDI